MSKAVLDASALLVLLKEERGSEDVATAITDGAAISAVNFAEVVGKLSEAGVPEAVTHEMLDPLGMEILELDTDLAYQTGLLRANTRQSGLSLGDRACLALAQNLDLPVLTADRVWSELQLGLKIQVVR